MLEDNINVNVGDYFLIRKYYNFIGSEEYIIHVIEKLNSNLGPVVKFEFFSNKFKRYPFNDSNIMLESFLLNGEKSTKITNIEAEYYKNEWLIFKIL